ncbi:salicylate carboxymethyltransferase-like [Papaver somniferum]|uniref:salicylate carboxymethyltransferase-like n=1 Tax=Papaver somniferum TaxID=3469 RepID=UPI000E6F53E9|nr:salicylate carboxymethyltransferase-like [Papaver somniferum]
MEVAQNFHMNGGTGETSYSSNSFVQRKGIEMTKPVIEEAMLDLISEHSAASPLNTSQCLNIADMGCSSGPNALLVVSYIMDIIYRKYSGTCDDVHGDRSPPHPKILVFLNDLPCNDFTTTFKSLGNFYDKLKDTYKLAGTDDEPQHQPCFIAGIPGSFYARLFPDDTLHFVHSSYSLHWLSKIPQGIGKCNKGNIYMAERSPPYVVEAYMKQFSADFKIFLKCRSKEVVKGGRMVLTILGRGDDVGPSSKECCYIWELLANAFKYMMIQGKIKEEDLDLFNVHICGEIRHPK